MEIMWNLLKWVEKVEFLIYNQIVIILLIIRNLKRKGIFYEKVKKVINFTGGYFCFDVIIYDKIRS